MAFAACGLELLGFVMATVCRNCGRDIEWVRGIDGKGKPLDPGYVAYDEAEPGDILITDQGVSFNVDYARLFPGVKGRILHFVTCPGTENWRRKHNIKQDKDEC